jgi:hypothetical protein
MPGQGTTFTRRHSLSSCDMYLYPLILQTILERPCNGLNIGHITLLDQTQETMIPSTQIKLTLTAGQHDLMAQLLDLYGLPSVPKLAKYFVEKGIEAASTKQDLHGQVDLLKKLMDVAKEQAALQPEMMETLQDATTHPITN